MSKHDPERRSELKRQLGWRMALVVVVALVVVMVSSFLRYQKAQKGFAESQTASAQAFYQGRLIDMEEGWAHEAVSLKSRLEFSHVLEDPARRQTLMQSYFTVQGEERVFSHVYVLNRQGQMVASAVRTSSHDVRAWLPKAQGSPFWLYDPEHKHLYRGYRQSVWLGGEGQGQLVLLLPIDHAVLYSNAAYQSELFVMWQAQAVASSLGASGLKDPHLAQLEGGWSGENVQVEQRALTWGTQTPAPTLLVRQTIKNAVPLRNVWLFGLLIVGGLTGVIWLVVVRWMAGVTERVAVLGEVSREFSSQSTLSPPLRQRLEAAGQKSNDEIHDVATSLLDLMQAVQSREQELARRVRSRTAELQHANERAAEVNRMLYTVLDTIPVRLFWKDLDLVYLGCNQLFAQDAGQPSPREVIGKTDFDLAWRQMAGIYRKDDAHVISSGQPKLSYEQQLTDSHGKQTWLRASKVPLRDAAGEVVGLLGTYEDITEHKKTDAALLAARDAAEAASRAKSEFLASMSHELRTPLNAILGFSQLFAMDSLLSQATRDNAQEIERAGQHLLSLVNDLIDLARIEAGRLELSLEPVSVEQVLRDSLALVAPIADKQGIALINEGGDHLMLVVQADYVRLRQVLINLLSNAIKYNRPQGTVRVSCALHDGLVHIAIADIGRGIPADKQERIFSAFDRLGEERGQVEGTGIGLVITRRIVEAMGGRVGFESVEGQGSTFWVEFAIREAPLLLQQEAVPAQITAPQRASLEENKIVVLYIEDNPMNLRLMQQIFARRPGLELRDAHTAELGIELARVQPPQLILMDINLPGMNGFEALAVLKADPRTATIPVVAVSANAMKGDRERGMASGFVDYLTKPINIQALFELLDKVVQTGTSTQGGTS